MGKSCKSVQDDGVTVTLTMALGDALRHQLHLVVEQPQERRLELALMGFVAELCWANYLSPSEHTIRRTIDALINDTVHVDRLDAVALFVGRVGPILCANPLEQFTVLD